MSGRNAVASSPGKKFEPEAGARNDELLGAERTADSSDFMTQVRMDDQRALLRHFLAALAYRTQKALRDAPPEFSEFRAGLLVRTPHELIRHMDGVLGYALRRGMGRRS